MSVRTITIASGFYSDVYNLLEKFSEAAEIRIKEFTSVWRKMEFMKIFVNREGKELILFTEECFRTVLRLILSEHPVQFRVGALFCLYSIYMAQPSKPKVKIRLVPEIWKGIQSLIDESQLEPWEDEIKFAFWTLAYQNAFLFVAKPNFTGLVTTATEDDVLSVSNFNRVMEDYMNSDHQLLQELHMRYLGLKDLVSSATKPAEMVEKDLFVTVDKEVEALQDKFNICSKAVQQNEDTAQCDAISTEESDEQEDEDDTLERRRKVRTKQQILHVHQSKSRRHRETDAPEKQSPAKPKVRGRPRGPSSGIRKNQNIAVQENDSIFQQMDVTP